MFYICCIHCEYSKIVYAVFISHSRDLWGMFELIGQKKFPHEIVIYYDEKWYETSYVHVGESARGKYYKSWNNSKGTQT